MALTAAPIPNGLNYCSFLMQNGKEKRPIGKEKRPITFAELLQLPNAEWQGLAT
jgi:hypothetical protein